MVTFPLGIQYAPLVCRGYTLTLRLNSLRPSQDQYHLRHALLALGTLTHGDSMRKKNKVPLVTVHYVFCTGYVVTLSNVTFLELPYLSD